jgi:hypothetical protein
LPIPNWQKAYFCHIFSQGAHHPDDHQRYWPTVDREVVAN